jgi:hypothetical protein
VSVVHGRYIAATPFDGIVLQPESDMQSASAEAGSGSRN